MIREQSVGEHTYNVICLIYYLTEGNPRPDLVKFALFHDVPEYRLGDAPAPVKWNYKELKAQYILAEEEIWKEFEVPKPQGIGVDLILKAADSFECALYAIEEFQTGNTRMLSVASRALHYLDTEIAPTYLNIWRNAGPDKRFKELYNFCRSRAR